ncbi:MAG: HAD-IIB family hydrolase [Mesorhizobium sp.]|uniref:HAD-IIB family hydrolase n=1 Tax=Mesorhizobium sp. TaxID=1871066 RepID=UPI0011F58B3B|nr:HAD-IIB family hydrolase [Mesorhizobium sp.]TIO11240.1 MAG: HAD-IIB family hydrolase [Mesorhizobium sp.]TIO33516.1 MAG: HAD-IIB family hydrolase [Mesorhizobium sp.]TIP14696.1 MAG: HAD-IIB family hydrolase [Mesorhizobium sp.]
MRPIALLSSDLDGTLAGHPPATSRFRSKWEALDPEHRPLLVYNSGRLADDILNFVDDVGLPAPDYVIGGVGTMLAGPRHTSRLEHFAERFSEGWSLEKVDAVLGSLKDTVRQPDVYQHAFKSSWYLHDASSDDLAGIERALDEAGLSVTMIYSSGRDLDILPRSADKGQALAWLCNELGIGLDEVVVAGDTNNDRSMFDLPGARGIVVANALPELRDMARDNPLIYNAKEQFALGVVEGLVHWLVFADARS